jgi:small subunit ribosomal protein S18
MKTSIETNKKVKKNTKNTSCYFTQTGTTPNYKDVLVLRRFISDRGKVLPQKGTGLTAKNQRLLAREIKKARFMGLLPYTEKHAI